MDKELILSEAEFLGKIRKPCLTKDISICDTHVIGSNHFIA